MSQSLLSPFDSGLEDKVAIHYEDNGQSATLGEKLKASLKFIFSPNDRTTKIRQMISSSIETWQKRGALTLDQASLLEEQLADDNITEYLSDWGSHIAATLAAQGTQWVVRALTITDYIPKSVWLQSEIFLGSLYRGAYSTYAITKAKIQKKPIPYFALGGFVPKIGPLAYPCQIAYSSRPPTELTSFIALSTVTKMAEKVPIIGGPESKLEYLFNKVGYHFFVKKYGLPNTNHNN